MKKSLVALAVLAAAGAASAQSSVTLFGIVDATYAIGKGSTSNKTQLTNSGYNSSRLGFRGVEDLGGGMQAGFWLEAGLTNDDGRGAGTSTNNQATGGAIAGLNGGQGLTFNRRSTVGFGAKSWGEIRLGRDYTPHFWTHTVYDPFGTNGVGTTQTLNSAQGGTTTVRASNSITYLYGHGFNSTFVGGAGFHAALQYYLGENNTGAATSNDGKGTSMRLGYGAGPFSVAFATGTTKFAAGNITTTNFGGNYNLGVADLMALYNTDKNKATGVKQTGYLLGANVPMGAGMIRAAYSTSKTSAAGSAKTNKIALGYVHNLSKRTALYGTFARVTNNGGATQSLNGAVTAANNSSTGYDFGVRHAF
jgi:predicted porin